MYNLEKKKTFIFIKLKVGKIGQKSNILCNFHHNLQGTDTALINIILVIMIKINLKTHIYI